MWRIYYNESYPWASNTKTLSSEHFYGMGRFVFTPSGIISLYFKWLRRQTDDLWQTVGRKSLHKFHMGKTIMGTNLNSQIREAQKAKAPWTEVYAIQILLPTLYTPMPLFLTMPEQGLSQFVSHRP